MQLMGRSDPREMAMADHSMTAWHLLTGFVQQHVQRATCAYLCPLLKGQKMSTVLLASHLSAHRVSVPLCSGELNAMQYNQWCLQGNTVMCQDELTLSTGREDTGYYWATPDGLVPPSAMILTQSLKPPMGSLQVPQAAVLTPGHSGYQSQVQSHYCSWQPPKPIPKQKKTALAEL